MNVDTIMNDLVKKHPGEVEYHQAVREVLESIEEVYNEKPSFSFGQHRGKDHRARPGNYIQSALGRRPGSRAREPGLQDPVQ